MERALSIMFGALCILWSVPALLTVLNGTLPPGGTDTGARALSCWALAAIYWTSASRSAEKRQAARGE